MTAREMPKKFLLHITAEIDTVDTDPSLWDFAELVEQVTHHPETVAPRELYLLISRVNPVTLLSEVTLVEHEPGRAGVCASCGGAE